MIRSSLGRLAPLLLLGGLAFLVAAGPEGDSPRRKLHNKSVPLKGDSLDPTSDKPGQRAAIAERRIARGQYRYAAKLFRAILDHRPDDARAKSGLGRALSGIGRCTEAMPWLEQVRPTRFWDQETAVAVGRCHERAGEYDLAHAAYEEALTFERDYAVGWYTLAQLELRMGRPDAAFEIENLLLTMEDGGRMSSMLTVWRERDERGDAFAWEAWLDFVRVLDRGGQSAKSANVQSDLLEGVLWLDTGDPIAAQEALKRAVAAQPQHVRARIFRAEAWRRMGLPEQAMYEISDDWLVGPDPPAAQPIRAKILADLGQMDAAVAELDGYPDALDPEMLAARWYLADKAGDSTARAAALAAWEAAVGELDRPLAVQIPFRP